MDLIEQLGGYERARSIANCKSGVVHPTKQLLDALLQYRREHGVYEVGDSFVFNNGDNPEIMKVQHVWDDAVWGGYCGEIPKNTDIRHATDAEIEAGCKTMTDHAYKIGDKVVYKDTLHCKPVLMQIIEFGEVSKIPRCEIIGSVGAIGLKGPALVDLIRHATNEEIKAGRRL